MRSPCSWYFVQHLWRKKAGILKLHATLQLEANHSSCQVKRNCSLVRSTCYLHTKASRVSTARWASERCCKRFLSFLQAEAAEGKPSSQRADAAPKLKGNYVKLNHKLHRLPVACKLMCLFPRSVMPKQTLAATLAAAAWNRWGGRVGFWGLTSRLLLQLL